MKILVEIPDKQAPFGMAVLRSLSFVRKASPISTKVLKLWDNLNESAEEIRLHKQGKIQLKSVQDLIDEL